MEECRDSLDLLVVPIMFVVYMDYHILLLYITRSSPERTHLGSKIHQLRVYRDFILWMDEREREAFREEISSLVTLANTYGCYSVALICFIGGPLTKKGAIVNCDGIAVKCGTVLVFALAALLCLMVGGEILGEAKSLINRPHGRVQPGYIGTVVVKGFIFCQAGSRLFYFSLALVAWFVGPIPMLAASLMLLIALFMKDMIPEPRPRREMIHV